MLVLDTSTLVLLAKIDVLPLLARRTRLLIPPEVEREALMQPQLYDAQLIGRMIRAGTLERSRRVHPTRYSQLQTDFRLGAGEAASLLAAKGLGVPVGTDDGPAIRAAKILGVPFVTAVHLLVELCEKGRIDREQGLARLETLQHVGRYGIPIVEHARERIRRAR
jgi:predicted nucleic acid-binding protein